MPYYRRKLRSRRLFKIDLGEYRLFVTVTNHGDQLTLGFPLNDCRDRRVWVEDYEGPRKISYNKAKAMLSNSLRSSVLNELRMNGLTRLIGNA